MFTLFAKQRSLRWLTVGLLAVAAAGAADDDLPIIDAHIHYSHDAWENLPPDRAIGVLRDAGLKHAFVSSSSDDGTQKLFEQAPELVVPVLRPYRKRGELSTWIHDLTVLTMLRDRTEKYRYAGIGEFHAFGEQVDLPVMRGVIALAGEHRLFLHAHSDSDAIDRIFVHDPDAIVLWAHSGFEGPEAVGDMLEKHKNLWADLAFRSEQAHDGRVDPDWQDLFERFPDRFLLGTDTFTPERWYYVVEHANWSRQWLSSLPDDVAENIAWKNARALLEAVKWR